MCSEVIKSKYEGRKNDIGILLNRIKGADYAETVKYASEIKVLMKDRKGTCHIWALLYEIIHEEYGESQLEFLQTQLTEYMNMYLECEAATDAVERQRMKYIRVCFATVILMLTCLTAYILLSVLGIPLKVFYIISCAATILLLSSVWILEYLNRNIDKQIKSGVKKRLTAKNVMAVILPAVSALVLAFLIYGVLGSGGPDMVCVITAFVQSLTVIFLTRKSQKLSDWKATAYNNNELCKLEHEFREYMKLMQKERDRKELDLKPVM